MNVLPNRANRYRAFGGQDAVPPIFRRQTTGFRCHHPIGRARRAYPAEFRRRVIELVEGGRKISEVSKELGGRSVTSGSFKTLNVATEMSPILWYPIPGIDWERWLGA